MSENIIIDLRADLVNADGACKEIGGEETPISKPTLYRGIKAGRYPPPIHVGPNTRRWRRSELRAALQREARP